MWMHCSRLYMYPEWAQYLPPYKMEVDASTYVLVYTFAVSLSILLMEVTMIPVFHSEPCETMTPPILVIGASPTGPGTASPSTRRQKCLIIDGIKLAASTCCSRFCLRSHKESLMLHQICRGCSSWHTLRRHQNWWHRCQEINGIISNSVKNII